MQSPILRVTVSGRSIPLPVIMLKLMQEDTARSGFSASVEADAVVFLTCKLMYVDAVICL